jgi:hypothetical protein
LIAHTIFDQPSRGVTFWSPATQEPYKEFPRRDQNVPLGQFRMALQSVFDRPHRICAERNSLPSTAGSSQPLRSLALRRDILCSSGAVLAQQEGAYDITPFSLISLSRKLLSTHHAPSGNLRCRQEPAVFLYSEANRNDFRTIFVTKCQFRMETR